MEFMNQYNVNKYFFYNLYKTCVLLEIYYDMYILGNFGKNNNKRISRRNIMEENKLKNMVILKNLPSNIVEEAILVLKQNKVKLPEYAPKQEIPEGKESSREYILKEAQMVIADYLGKIESNKILTGKKNTVLERKYKRLRLCTLGIAIAFVLVMLF